MVRIESFAGEICRCNLQAGSGGKAKRYQVEEVLGVIDRYGLEV